MALCLNRLENAVLAAMCNRSSPANSVALRRQIANVSVKDRNNTGAGFFTYLKVDAAQGQIGGVIADVFARIEGMNNPMAFVLFVRDGTAHMLEGAAIGESTERVDFSSVKFEII